MLFVPALTVLFVAANAYNPEIVLAKWNPRYRYAIEKICEKAESQKYRSEYYDPEDDYETTTSTIFGQKPQTRKEWRELRHCCNKDSHYEKKECLKDVRRNILDNQCDKGLKHICCKKEYENRYVCFTRNPFNVVSDLVDDYERPSSCYATGECPSPRNRRRAVATLLAETVLRPEVGAILEQQMENMETSSIEDDEEELYTTLRRRETFDREEEEIADRLDQWTRNKWTDSDLEERMAEREILEKASENRVEKDMLREAEAIQLAKRLANPLTSRLYNDDEFSATPEAVKLAREESYVQESLEDKLENERDRETDRLSRKLRRALNNEEIVDEETMYYQETEGTPCHESRRCKKKVRVITNEAAKRVCDNTLSASASPKQKRHSCRFGHLVGKVAGRKHPQSCRYAARKFEEKASPCLVDKHQSKRIFRECCQTAAEKAREERVVEKTLRRVEDEPSTFETRRTNPFVFF